MSERGLDLQAAIVAQQAVRAGTLVSVADEANAGNLHIMNEGVGFARFVFQEFAALHVGIGVALGGVAGDDLASQIAHVLAARLSLALGHDGGEHAGGRYAEAGREPFRRALLQIVEYLDHDLPR